MRVATTGVAAGTLARGSEGVLEAQVHEGRALAAALADANGEREPGDDLALTAVRDLILAAMTSGVAN